MESSSADLAIGAVARSCFDTPNPAFFFKGKIDEVRVYDPALGAADMAALANYNNFSVDLTPKNAGYATFSGPHDEKATLTPALSFIPVSQGITTGPNSPQFTTLWSNGSGATTFSPGDPGGQGDDHMVG